MSQHLHGMPFTKADAGASAGAAAFLEDLIDACVMESHVREHMAKRDLLLRQGGPPDAPPKPRACCPCYAQRPQPPQPQPPPPPTAPTSSPLSKLRGKYETSREGAKPRRREAMKSWQIPISKFLHAFA